MEILDLFIFSLSFIFLAVWWRRCFSSSKSTTLPPGPPGWPLVGNLFQVLLQRRHFIFIVRELRKKYGPIFTMQMGQRTLVIVTSPELIHEALVQKGPVFASRPPDSPIRLVFSVGKCAVNSAEYGPLWRTLRRNFVTELMNPVRIRQCSWIREWAMENHMKRLQNEALEQGCVDVMEICRFTVCSILVCICFGAKISEDWIREIDSVTKDVMLITTPQLPDFLPILTPLFRRQMKIAKELRKKQVDCIIPLIRNRRAYIEKGENPDSLMVSPVGAAYVDSLFGLEAPGRGQLGDQELVTLCTELFVAGIDTSTSVLQWIFLELVLNQDIQEKVYMEIIDSVGKNGLITEETVEKWPYLNAVVKESLRLHSPAHFTLSHAATEETELGGYKIPTDVNVEFYIEWMTEDPNMWKDPEVFRPERFLEGDGVDVDLTGTKGTVKMLPFGAGRRTCPGLALGLLHVNLMLAKMVQAFKWVPTPNGTPDPSETFAFTVVMKNPLKAVILPR
ncbi:cytochrome P450 77A1-like [Mercurialis annua]|uniref:cytochrome P450 77A1-like n=1 Tax=Mercurialis annua TaxID=3986 RepID=UPI00216058F4|nr:cytochrome P450 77A1-like [Mercurialis annua]